MNPTMETKIQDLFALYERAFNTFDVDSIANVYTESSLGAVPGRVACITDNETLHAVLTQAYEGYRNSGLTSMRIVEQRPSELGDYHALVTILYEARYQQTGDTPIRFEVSYIVQFGDDAAKIVAFVSHGDEQALLRSHGIG